MDSVKTFTNWYSQIRGKELGDSEYTVDSKQLGYCSNCNYSSREITPLDFLYDYSQDTLVTPCCAVPALNSWIAYD
jgi:hypothetical protein